MLDEVAQPAAESLLAGAVARQDISEFLDVWLRHDLLPEQQGRVLRDYYCSYVRHFGPYLRHHYRNQTRELMALLDRTPAARVLEVGCGCGTESLWMAAHGYSIFAVDVTHAFLEVAAARKSVLERALGCALSCDFAPRPVLDVDGAKYDVVWMENAFHHLEPRELVVEKISGLMRPGGHLVISEANAWNPLTQLQLFMLRGTKTIITHQGVTWGHERILTAPRLCREFRRRGVDPISVRYFRTLPNRKWADTLTGRIGFFDDADRWWMRPLYTHYTYVGRKRS